MSDGDRTSANWESFLRGTDPGLHRMRRVLGHIPTDPRCKLCAAPFAGVGAAVLKPFGFGPSELNRRICTICLTKTHRSPGGAELEITVLFADVRGSTALAEKLPPEDYSRLLARFYGTAARVVDAEDGIVDKFVGDAAVALFIPGFAGEEHAARALAAGRALLEATAGDNSGEPWIPLGVGVHTGLSYVGVVGEGDARDFTAVGDTVNTAARLSDTAGAGELVVSAEAAEAGGLDTSGLEARTLELKGREQAVAAWVLEI